MLLNEHFQNWIKIRCFIEKWCSATKLITVWVDKQICRLWNEDRPERIFSKKMTQNVTVNGARYHAMITFFFLKMGVLDLADM